MAPGGVLLAAEQGDRARPDLALKPTYTIEERPRALDERLVYPALRIVKLLALGPSAQLLAEEKVPDPVGP